MKTYCPQCQKTYEGEQIEVCPEDGSRLYQLNAPTNEDPLIGTVVDERFRIEEMLGEGGMGAVYRGVQLSVHREVAIKVLRPELAGREQALERFFREARVVSELTHPNIVRLIEFGQDRSRDLLYLVMELVRGEDMGWLLKRGRLRTNLALEVVYQICGALTEPHARGIVHRDLKPENLVLLPISDGTLQVKVLDFGIARNLEGGTQLTKTGMICGTPAYMAPEQAQNFALDGRTDLYALGVMLFEMLSGRPPFVGDTSLQILLNHIQKPAPDLTKSMAAGSVPVEVAELVRDLLEKDPDKRPASARVVRDRIDALRTKLMLKPVRLDSASETEDPFGAWVIAREEISGDAHKETGADLPLGMARAWQNDSTRAETIVQPRRQTEREFLGVADTLVAESVVAESAEPTPSTEDEGSDSFTNPFATAQMASTNRRHVVPLALVALVVLVGGGYGLYWFMGSAVEEAEALAAEVEAVEVVEEEITTIEEEIAEAEEEIVQAAVETADEVELPVEAEKTEKTEKTEQAEPAASAKAQRPSRERPAPAQPAPAQPAPAQPAQAQPAQAQAEAVASNEAETVEEVEETAQVQADPEDEQESLSTLDRARQMREEMHTAPMETPSVEDRIVDGMRGLRSD